MYDASREMQNSNNVSTNIELFLLRKAEKSEVNIFSLGADSDLQADLLSIFTNYFQRSEKRDYVQSEYDVVTSGKFDKEYYKTKTSEYAGVKKFVELFNSIDLDDIKGLKEDSFFAYAVRIRIEEQQFIFIAPFSKVSKISATKVIGNLKNNKLTKIKNDATVGFSSSISMLILDDEVLILNNLRIFEKCCGMKAEFVKGAQSLLQNIAQFDSIEDLGELQKVIESDSVVAKRLTKLNQSFERVQSFFNNKDKVENLLNDDAFKDKFKDIKYNNGKLQFDRKNRHAFITLISDACYETIVGKTKGIDNGF